MSLTLAIFDAQGWVSTATIDPSSTSDYSTISADFAERLNATIYTRTKSLLKPGGMDLNLGFNIRATKLCVLGSVGERVQIEFLVVDREVPTVNVSKDDLYRAGLYNSPPVGNTRERVSFPLMVRLKAKAEAASIGRL